MSGWVRRTRYLLEEEKESAWIVFVGDRQQGAILQVPGVAGCHLIHWGSEQGLG